MALVQIQTGRGRQKFYEFVVVGDDARGCKRGDIRWVQWDRSKSSPMLKIEWVNTERSAVKEIRLDADYRKRGWKLLRDMYSAEDEKSGRCFEDFKAFAQTQQDNPEGMRGRKFPEERLPRELELMRSSQRQAEERAKAFRFPSDGAAIDDDDDVTVDEDPTTDEVPEAKAAPSSEPAPQAPKTTRARKRS